jgi:hypothetical protein
MPSALGYGLMGAAQGALQGAYQVHQNEMQRQESERLLAARAAQAQAIAEIEAKYASAKDERDHVQAKELATLKDTNADERMKAQEASRDKRESERNAARIEAAKVRASTPRGEGTKPKQQLFTNDEGEQKWIAPGEDIPAGFYRAPSSGKPKVSDKPKPAAAAAKPDPNAPPMEGARKAPDGNWYVQQNGKWFKVEP